MALYFNYHFLYISGSLMLKGDCRGGFYSHDWSWDQLGQWDRGRPPRLPIISISHQLQRSAGGGSDDAGGTNPASWDGEVNGATSNLKY